MTIRHEGDSTIFAATTNLEKVALRRGLSFTLSVATEHEMVEYARTGKLTEEHQDVEDLRRQWIELVGPTHVTAFDTQQYALVWHPLFPLESLKKRLPNYQGDSNADLALQGLVKYAEAYFASQA